MIHSTPSNVRGGYAYWLHEHKANARLDFLQSSFDIFCSDHEYLQGYHYFMEKSDLIGFFKRKLECAVQTDGDAPTKGNKRGGSGSEKGKEDKQKEKEVASILVVDTGSSKVDEEVYTQNQKKRAAAPTQG